MGSLLLATLADLHLLLIFIIMVQERNCFCVSVINGWLIGISAAGTRRPARRPGTCWRFWRSWMRPTSAASFALLPAPRACRLAAWARCSPGMPRLPRT